MPRDFIPAREPELVTWTTNFASLIGSMPTAFGLVAAQATAYQTLSTAFITAYNTARGDGTRTPAAISTKNQA
jgi:hypothetical protein